MRCIQCGHLKDKVIDSRISRDGTSIRRRRLCLKCGYRYTTYESIERTELLVIKKDGTREILKKEKLLQGMRKACEKRPVPVDRLDRAVDDILLTTHQAYNKEVPVKVLGMQVMNKLHELDPVAYIRYVSVYREFDNVKEFIEEIQSLERRSTLDHAQLRTASLENENTTEE